MKKFIIFLFIILSFTNVYAKPVTDYSSQSGADVSSSDLFLTIDVSEPTADQTKKINSYDLGIGLSEHIVGKNVVPVKGIL
jgi:hypothetical protein